MGIFDFFKKILAEKEQVEEVQIEKISLSDISNWIANKVKENEILEKQVIENVKEKISVFSQDLKLKLEIAESVDISSKKAEERVKNIVIDSRDKYVEFVEILLEKLNHTKDKNLEEFINYINVTFESFNKSSHTNYEKATFLIGKEMASIRESLREFSKDLIKIFDENKNIVDFLKKVPNINIRLKQFKDSEEDIKKIDLEITSIDKKISEKTKDIDDVVNKIRDTKNSPEYIKNIQSQKRILILKDDLEKEILSLKQLLDFKALSNFFHIFEDQMVVVKAHKEDFNTHFKKDKGEKILNLLNEAKLNNEIIDKRVSEIRKKIEDIETYMKNIKKDETEDLAEEKTKIAIEVGDLRIEKSKEEKRKKKFEVMRHNLIEIIRKELEKLNVEVV